MIIGALIGLAIGWATPCPPQVKQVARVAYDRAATVAMKGIKKVFK